jgi:hypothetical protein
MIPNDKIVIGSGADQMKGRDLCGTLILKSF